MSKHEAHERQLDDGDYVLMVEFGGGYSVGTAPLPRCAALTTESK